MLLCQLSPAGAVPPPGGTEATRSIDSAGFPSTRATCPVGTGPIEIGSPGLTAACDANPHSATPDGASTFTVTTVIGGGSANFRDVASSCTKGSAVTGGSVTVFSGVAGAPFTTSTPNQLITDNNGIQYILNEVITDGTNVTRNAIRVLSGTATGFISGQVICPLAVYPLAVDTAAPAQASMPLPELPVDSSPPVSMLPAVGIGALVLAQVVLGLSLRRSRAQSPSQPLVEPRSAACVE